MGAFVFAAQMINFPVGIGTSGHLVGGALLACTLGPAAASVVMTAILAIQALVFQDGGILALGANVINMAVAGRARRLSAVSTSGARGRWRRQAIFAGGALSLAGERRTGAGGIADLRRPDARLGAGRLAGSVCGVGASRRRHHAGGDRSAGEHSARLRAQAPSAGRSLALGAVGLVAILLAGVGVLFASTRS